MRPLDLLQLVAANLNRMRGRVALTAFGVAIGTAAVLGLVSLGAGLQRSAAASLGNIGDLKRIDVYSYPTGPIEAPASEKATSARPNEPQGLTRARLDELAAIEGVQVVAPVEELQGGATLRLRKYVSYSSIVALSPEGITALGLAAAVGKTQPATGEAVVGAQIQQTFFDEQRGEQAEIGELMGETLSLEVVRYDKDGNPTTRTLRLRVAGVLEQESADADYQILLPQTDVQKLNDWLAGKRIDRKRQGYNRAIVLVNDSRDVPEVQEAIRKKGYEAYSPLDTLREINRFFGILQAILGGIGAIALLVAAFGIINTLSMAILERTREIGLMKALGARNRDVMTIFLGEAASIGMLGGLTGTVVGYSLTTVGNILARGYMAQQGGDFLFGGPSDQPADLIYTPLWLVLFVICFATLVGLLSGIYPALRAATLDPLRALKAE